VVVSLASLSVLLGWFAGACPASPNARERPPCNRTLTCRASLAQHDFPASCQDHFIRDSKHRDEHDSTRLASATLSLGLHRAVSFTSSQDSPPSPVRLHSPRGPPRLRQTGRRDLAASGKMPWPASEPHGPAGSRPSTPSHRISCEPEPPAHPEIVSRLAPATPALRDGPTPRRIVHHGGCSRAVLRKLPSDASRENKIDQSR
jgi:hypothetical protein